MGVMSCNSTPQRELPITPSNPEDISINTQLNGVNVEVDSLINELKRVKSYSAPESNAYWKLVKIGEPAIPQLIENLDNPQQTNCFDVCKGFKPLTVGDLALFTLEEIAEFPPSLVTQIQFCTLDENGCGGWTEFSYDPENKDFIKEKWREFYELTSYEKTEIPSEKRTKAHLKFEITHELSLKSN